VLFFLGMFTMELVHISSERKRVKREQKWDLNMDGFIKIDTSDPINPVKMWESTTTFGNTIKMIITLLVVIIIVFGGLVELIVGFALGVLAQRSLKSIEREKRINEATKRIWPKIEDKIKKGKVN